MTGIDRLSNTHRGLHRMRMMIALQKFFDIFSKRAPSHDLPYIFKILEISPCDIEKAYEKLNLANAAKQNGQANIPGTDDTELDGPQQTIVQSTEGRIQPVLAKVEVVLKGLGDQIRRVELEPALRRIRSAPDRCREKLKRGLDDASARIAPVREDFHASLNEYEKFRLDWNITRPPYYPEQHVPHIVRIIFILLCETACNAYFFARGTDYGYVGGAAQAFVLALVDILIVFWLGRLIPWAGLPASLRKLVGIVSFLLFIAWALAYNLAVAHFRDQLRFDPLTATHLALDSLVANPIGLADIESWALFALGVVFSFMAMLDGIRWDDPIPGYSQAHRRVQAARAQYKYEVETLTESGIEIHRAAGEEVDRTAQRCRDEVVSLTNSLETILVLLANIKKFVDHYEGCCNALISKYRDDNRRFRTSPPPEYFQHRWKYPIDHAFERGIETEQRKQREQKEKAAQATRLHGNVRKELDESITWFSAEVRKLQDPLMEGWKEK